MPTRALRPGHAQTMDHRRASREAPRAGPDGWLPGYAIGEKHGTADLSAARPVWSIAGRMELLVDGYPKQPPVYTPAGAATSRESAGQPGQSKFHKVVPAGLRPPEQATPT